MEHNNSVCYMGEVMQNQESTKFFSDFLSHLPMSSTSPRSSLGGQSDAKTERRNVRLSTLTATRFDDVVSRVGSQEKALVALLDVYEVFIVPCHHLPILITGTSVCKFP